MIMAGIVIGSGIFVTTGIMAKNLPSAGMILFVWGLGGLITLAGALTYAELAAAMYAVSKGDLPEPVQAIFHPLHGNVMYRPILHRVDSLADGSIRFKIVFCQDVSWQVRDTPPKLRSLLTSLVMSTRFRYELLKKFLFRDGCVLDEVSSTKLFP